MDGLIILAVILLIFRGITKRAKDMRQTGNTPSANRTPQTVVLKPKPAAPKTIPTPQMEARVRRPSPAQGTGSLSMTGSTEGLGSTEGEARYRVITPSVQQNNLQRAYTGSLGGASTNGNASSEGTGAYIPQVTQQMRPSFFQTATEPEPEQRVVPSLEGNALLQAFVMSEILTRPRSKWGR